MQQPIPHFETGDLLLYNTTKYWYSRAIEWFTSSDYSHVSMVLRRPTWLDPSLCEEEYYVLESGSERFPDAVSGDFKFGVQVCPLSKVWAEYASQGYGHLYVRRIRFLCPNPNGDSALIDGIKTAYAKVKACPYDLNPCDWIKCYFDEHKTLQQIEATSQRDQKTTSFWCSALMSFVLVVAGFLDKSVPWTVITPYDFSAFRAPQRLAFQGCAYDAEVKLC
jgi:hypothetical protein|uniref:Peptidase n=1 Tax=viral metagenome TaxID=1070528 RepID=A0A6C0LZJ5_9ZZZZ